MTLKTIRGSRGSCCYQYGGQEPSRDEAGGDGYLEEQKGDEAGGDRYLEEQKEVWNEREREESSQSR